MDRKRPAKSEEEIEAARTLILISRAAVGFEEANKLRNMLTRHQKTPTRRQEPPSHPTRRCVGCGGKLPNCPCLYAPESTLNLEGWANYQYTPRFSIDGSELPRYPPIPYLEHKVDRMHCSVPFEKMLTPSDLNHGQNRLTMTKDEVIMSILPLLKIGEDIARGVKVTIYSPEGKKYKMEFKSWANYKYYVLKSGWSDFYIDNMLEPNTDFVTIWAFHHARTRRLCFALTWKRLQITQQGPLKKRQQRLSSR